MGEIFPSASESLHLIASLQIYRTSKFKEQLDRGACMVTIRIIISVGIYFAF